MSGMSSEGRSRSRNYTKQPLWLLGLSLVFLGSLADFLALGFAQQSMIAPLGYNNSKKTHIHVHAIFTFFMHKLLRLYFLNFCSFVRVI